ncbi:MAG: ComEC/Rec2 family competence protein [Chitinophagaceae bacterium]|nr:ComEC/Rec2 family competence protein [Chitinophagaceae bacterium]
MNFWAPFPLVRYVVLLILGILIAESVESMPEISLLHLLVFFLGYTTCILIFSFYRLYKNILFISLYASALFFLLGVVAQQTHSVLNKSYHFASHSPNFFFYRGNIIEEVTEKEHSYAFTVRVDKIFDGKKIIPTRSKVLIYLKKDTSLHPQKLFVYGTVLWIKGIPSKIKNSGNPYTFDIETYMKRKGLEYQHFVKKENLKIIGTYQENYLIAKSLVLKHTMRDIIRSYVLTKNEKGIAEALLLGIKEEVESGLIQSYVSAGVMHVLAVSGMHVALIFGIFSFLLSPIEKRKYGNFITFPLLLLILWTFAFVTGLSASVLRATVMFSLILFGKNIAKKSNVYNFIALSALLLLLYEPVFIFNPGFLLSYLAVIGIVYLYPLIYKSLEASHIVWDYVWSITAMSIAAQIGTLPIAMYYFYQFPTYFLVANIIIIPLSSAITFMGVALMSFYFVYEPIAFIIGKIFALLILLLNNTVVFISSLPQSTIYPLYVSAFQTVVLYLLLISLLALFSNKKFLWVKVCFVCFVLLIASKLVQEIQTIRQSKIIIYNIKQPIVEYQQGQTISIYYPKTIDSKTFDNAIKPYHIKNGIIKPFLKTTYDTIPSKMLKTNALTLLKIKNKKIAHIQKEILLKTPLKADIILVSYESLSPKILPSLSAAYIVFDGTNSERYLTNMLKDIPPHIKTHNTQTMGVFLLPL